MNDFETVRMWIDGDGDGDEVEAYAALDRLETEIEKKAVLAQSAMHSVQVLEAEVEKLRGTLKTVDSLLTAREAEVERLRAVLEQIAEQDARWHHDHREDVRNPVNIARAALAEEKE
jgi:FtsZ-binding cell division protein ZapB